MGVSGAMLPDVFVLMSCRTRRLYHAVFGEIRRVLGAPVRRFLSDWERALQGAAAAGWPEAVQSGCWFHYAQAIIRQIRRLGLRAEYTMEASAFSRWARKIVILPLVPADRLHEAWTLLLERQVPEVREKPAS
ncbi:uncharacterized protein LOC119114723 [Pollicipes pollicipes]|uniref:uncharacterized protein LOC119114723 n=1 Tax=Pollicipes pollicipes TaxID=41117 RepID=UPI0018850512|nr:uncharacterized protein LOC119114723 [Pollicipes pollicipes]